MRGVFGMVVLVPWCPRDTEVEAADCAQVQQAFGGYYIHPTFYITIAYML